MCLTNFCSNYVSVKVDNIESEDIKSYTIPVSSLIEDGKKKEQNLK